MARAYDGFEYLHITGATAEITCQTHSDICLSRVRNTFEKIDCSQNHTGRTDAALGAPESDESLLHEMELVFAGDSFDGSNRRPVNLRYGRETTVDQISVDQDGTGATLALATSL